MTPRALAYLMISEHFVERIESEPDDEGKAFESVAVALGRAFDAMSEREQQLIADDSRKELEANPHLRRDTDYFD